MHTSVIITTTWLRPMTRHHSHSTKNPHHREVQAATHQVHRKADKAVAQLAAAAITANGTSSICQDKLCLKSKRRILHHTQSNVHQVRHTFFIRVCVCLVVTFTDISLPNTQITVSQVLAVINQLLVMSQRSYAAHSKVLPLNLLATLLLLKEKSSVSTGITSVRNGALMTLATLTAEDLMRPLKTWSCKSHSQEHS